MKLENLQFWMALREKSQSEIARDTAVSRQAVSLWFQEALRRKDQEVLIRSDRYERLLKSLGVEWKDLSRPLPEVLGAKYDELQTLLLWDGLYGSLESFLRACAQDEPRALARFIQAFGIFELEKALGRKVWKRSDAVFMHLPNRLRNQYESLCLQLKNLKLV